MLAQSLVLKNSRNLKKKPNKNNIIVFLARHGGLACSREEKEKNRKTQRNENIKKEQVSEPSHPRVGKGEETFFLL